MFGFVPSPTEVLVVSLIFGVSIVVWAVKRARKRVRARMEEFDNASGAFSDPSDSEYRRGDSGDHFMPKDRQTPRW
jgi:hypothetical protein